MRELLRFCQLAAVERGVGEERQRTRQPGEIADRGGVLRAALDRPEPASCEPESAAKTATASSAVSARPRSFAASASFTAVRATASASAGRSSERARYALASVSSARSRPSVGVRRSASARCSAERCV